MPTSITFPADVLDQIEASDPASRRSTGYRSTRYISPAFRGLVYALILESLIVATACASYFGWHRLLHR
jgi:hypothetical protein